MKKMIFCLCVLIFVPGCDEQALQRVDAIVQDANTLAVAAEAVLKSPAAQKMPPDWRLYGALGVAVINGLGLTWVQWRKEQMKKTTKAIVKGIEDSTNPDKATAEIKANIRQKMIATGGEKFYARANKIVDQLKIE